MEKSKYEFKVGDIRVWNDGRKGKITEIGDDEAVVEFSDNVITSVSIDDINRNTTPGEAPAAEGAA